MITVYTKPSCVQCDATKRHLTKLGIEFDTVDITQDQDAFDKIIGMGFKAAPVVITDDSSWSGYQPDKINALADI
jgi:glutaredoxin-like protein NrdH